MNSKTIISKENKTFEDDEVFEDSAFLACFENTSFGNISSRNTANLSALNVSALCCDEEISGYDKLTGATWIYPTNYPVRDYQFNIIKSAIIKNTLVSLPTGLGKTFIAAVIMYNFYRWYPIGKIVFTAPTRPLVAQQIEACYNIVAIPSEDTIEMTGHMQVATRKAHWQKKRVFFATPQVIYNDIKSGICPAEKIRCLVIDEAHRARGNYAYCQIVSTLTDMAHKTYRVLALSATPGSKVEDVASVVRNLQIAHLELRTENCIDVAPYSHTRKIHTVIVELGPELSNLRHQFVEILDGYARRLKQLNILPHNLGNLSKGRVVMLYKEFQTKERSQRHPQHNMIMKDFTLLISLYHGLELLTKHGSRVFLNFFDEHPEKSWIQSDDNLTALLERLRDDLGINPLSLNRSILPDGTIPEIPRNLTFGHPKFDKLKEIMLQHFEAARKNRQDTRAIVFCEYRESVNLVHCLLLQCRPLITPQMFVGQGASGKDGKTIISQKQQLRVMRNFREGTCNALIATCVAEEGLDVGSVDLILCFDISTRSPIRLVQRCGRTGRERGGSVYILVTEGKEHQTLTECIRQRDGLNKKILMSKEVENSLYKTNPRLIPRDFMPKCQKMHITITKKEDPKDKKKETTQKNKKVQNDLRTMLLSRASTSCMQTSSINNVNTSTEIITEQEFKEMYPDGFKIKNYFDKNVEHWCMNKVIFKEYCKPAEKPILSTWLEWQRTLQKTVNFEHSKDTEILTKLLQYSDARRFDMPPSTQNPTFNTQDLATQNIAISSPTKPKQQQNKKKTKSVTAKSPAKKDGDIRALFSTATKSTKNYTKLINDLGIQNDGSIPTKLINLLVDLSIDNNDNKKCYICSDMCDCTLIQNLKNGEEKPNTFIRFLSDPKFPDVDLINDFDAESILKCAKQKHDASIHKDSAELTLNEHNNTKNFDLELDFESDFNNAPSPPIQNVECKACSQDKNFDIGEIDNLFNESSPEEAAIKSEEAVEINNKKPEEVFKFFQLDSIEDIFADDSYEVTENKPQTPEPKTENTTTAKIETHENADYNNALKDEQRFTPSILSGKVNNNNESFTTSPILCSQGRKFSLSIKKRQNHSTPITSARKPLYFAETLNNNKIDCSSSKVMTNNSIEDKSDKSMFTVTQIISMINKTNNQASITEPQKSEFLAPRHNFIEEDRSSSPILFTQADRKNSTVNVNARSSNNALSNQSKPIDSLIILDSDSDSDNTQIYDLEPCVESDLKEEQDTKSTNKRKYDSDESESLTASPFFNKRQKVETNSKKALTLQEKVLAAITSNKLNKNMDADTQINFVMTNSKVSIQKENRSPELRVEGLDDFKAKDCIKRNNLSMLQMFKRDSRIKSPKKIFEAIVNSPAKPSQKRKICFDDSDDDFEDTCINNKQNQKPTNHDRNAKLTQHKTRKKKKRKANSFIDEEAALSDSRSDSGDELSDESVGSIVDFICDGADNETCGEDIQAQYLRSVKSPVNGVFKIPNLPKKFNNLDVFSQYVEEDAYEMDSFCVDSHIGLTQVDEVSELELAEIVLETKRRSKKEAPPCESVNNCDSPVSRAIVGDSPVSRAIVDDDESPIVRRKNKNIKRIQSDSEDSS